MGAEELAQERAKILIADDEAPLRHVLRRLLEKEGWVAVEAESAAQALVLLAADPEVGVVLSDIMMPDMDGVELLRRAREQRPDVPVLLMTGAPQLESAVKAVEYGAFEYILKPWSSDKLYASVRRAVAEHHTAVERRRALDSAVRAKNAASGPRSAGGSLITTGTVLADRYRVVSMLGSGGMGTVYEAVRLDLGNMPVAVKVLHPKLADRADLLQRFRREAELVASIQHPNIVHVFDFVSEEGGPTFFVMELLRGRTLAAMVESSLSERRVAFIASQVLDALAAAHAKQVIHRDLKPENIFLTTMSGVSDIVRLLDFGIAKLMTEDATEKLTETGTVLGTPAYMAPEYARGETTGPAGDVYSLGCVMYEALTGKQPFAGQNYNAMLYAIQQKDVEPIASLRTDVSPEMTAVVSRAMARSPSARFPTATAMQEALAPWVGSAHARTMPPPIGSAPTEELVPDKPR